MIKGKIAIKDRGEIKPIDINDIIAVEVDVYQCTFYLENEEKHYLIQSLKETLSLLPADLFVQIKRDVIINLNKILKFKDNRIYLKSGCEYDIPFRKRKIVKDLIMKPNIQSWIKIRQSPIRIIHSQNFLCILFFVLSLSVFLQRVINKFINLKTKYEKFKKIRH